MKENHRETEARSEHVGPSLWHGREVNSCTRCKFLKCNLVKSGKRPDYEYFCMHPKILSGGYFDESESALLEKVRQRLPERVAYFDQEIKDRDADRMRYGQFISNDEYTPETPHWCPVVNERENAAHE